MTAPQDAALAAEKRRFRQQEIARLKSTPRDPSAGERLVHHLRPTIDAASDDATWALFASLPWEIDLGPLDAALISRKIQRLFPTMVDDALVFRRLPIEMPFYALAVGAFLVRTPTSDHPVVSLEECSIVVTPGVAFGLDKTRLGYGRGFYDRALSTARHANPAVRTIGVAHDHQIHDTVISLAHDLAVDMVVTDQGVRAAAR